MKTISKLSLVIAAIGAINWGLVGLFRWNLVDAIFGGGAYETTGPVSRIVYIIVGLAGVALLASIRYMGAPRDVGTTRFDRERPVGT
jgi:uncharacterized membrane protein YuzA (DUF378 family)